ncbi:MAG: CHASE domain-containing protein [Pseudomonadota bacterium]|nr:CHASE domain-containing protein [Pseudomonadota bacterium]
MLSAAYLVLGWVSGQLGIPPGYASAVWPPAGIAVAAAILWGPAAWPGIALGSGLLNSWLSLHATPGEPTLAVVAGALVGLGAAAQAGVAARMVARRLGTGNPLDRGQDVVLLLLLAGPVASLLNSTWSVAVLTLLGRLQPGQQLGNWLTWWVGDSIGVMLFTPMLLAWMAYPRHLWRRRWREVAGPLLLAAIAVVGTFVASSQQAELARRATFEAQANAAAGVIERELDRSIAFTESTARLFSAMTTVPESDFSEFVDPWLRVNPTIRALVWAPVVRSSTPPATASGATEAGRLSFYERDSGGHKLGVQPRALYVPVYYSEPQPLNAGAIGFDVASDPELADTLARARDSGEPSLSPEVTFNLTQTHERGVLVVAPVYTTTVTPPSVAERRAELRGYVLCAVRLGDLAASALQRSGRDDIALGVFDTTEGPISTVWTANTPRSADGMYTSTPVTLAGRRWVIDAWTTTPSSEAGAGWLLLAAGLGFSGLIAAFVLDAGARATRIELLVALRTAALAQSNEALRRSNLDLKRFAHVASHDMREPLRTIASFAELLTLEQAHRLDLTGRDHLNRILAAARRMQALVNNLLDLARVDSRAVPLAPVPLNSSVDAALENLHASIVECGARIEVGRLPVALADRVQMVQVFQNLLANGLEYRRPDVPPVLRVGARHTPTGWEIAVQDNGAGIERRHRERIFEMFERLQRDGRPPGRGVGLATCRSIVERHGGRIWVEAAPSGGSVFKFTLPGAHSPLPESDLEYAVP